jgi:hypothetical protein
MVDQYVLVDAGPSFTPLRFGLITAAEMPPVQPVGWGHGTQRLWPDCAPATSSVMIPCTGAPITGTPTATETVSLAADVFRVYGWVPCSPVGQGNDLEDLRRRAEALLTNGEGRAVEKVFWSGQTDHGGVVYPHLADDAQLDAAPQGAHTVLRQLAADVMTSGAVDAVEALSLVEGALGECYGGEGIIHVPRAAFAQLDHFGVVRQVGEQIRTLAGNRVAGYSGGVYPGPTGAEPAAGEGWFYGTGMVQVLRGPVRNSGVSPGEIIGRDDNTTVFLSYRDYSISFDCCLVATQVTLGGAG